MTHGYLPFIHLLQASATGKFATVPRPPAPSAAFDPPWRTDPIFHTCPGGAGGSLKWTACAAIFGYWRGVRTGGIGGHGAAVPHLRAGILGILQHSVEVAFLFKALRVRENAGDHAGTASATHMAGSSPPVMTKSPMDSSSSTHSSMKRSSIPS